MGLQQVKQHRRRAWRHVGSTRWEGSLREGCCIAAADACHLKQPSRARYVFPAQLLSGLQHPSPMFSVVGVLLPCDQQVFRCIMPRHASESGVDSLHGLRLPPAWTVSNGCASPARLLLA